MRRRLHALLRDEDGSSAAEFGIFGSTFILLVLFIIASGLLFWGKSSLQLTAAQTARCVAIGSTDCTDPTAYATSQLALWGADTILPTITVTVATGSTCGNTVGHYTKITIAATSGQVGNSSPSFFGAILNASACYPSGT